MDELQTEPRTLPAQPKRKLKTTDIVIILVTVAVVIAIVGLLMGIIARKRDLANAKLVTDKVVADIAKRDGAAARQLGDTKFKSDNSAEALTNRFEAIAPVTSFSRSVDRQSIGNGDSGKLAYVIYKYPTKDLAFYIRIVVAQNSKTGQWQLTSLTGNSDESTLIVD